MYKITVAVRDLQLKESLMLIFMNKMIIFFEQKLIDLIDKYQDVCD
jgi:hypothetical protein